MHLLQNNISYNVKDLIIFGLVIIIMSQTLYYIFSYGVNVPRQDEWGFVPFVVSYYEGDKFWEQDSFWQYGHHRQIVNSIITLINVSLTSWNVIYQMYFGWMMLVISVIVFYSILKNTRKNLIWLIVPITALLFNTSQTHSLLWALPSNASFTSTLGIITVIYFLNKQQMKSKIILLALAAAWFASFSEIHGLMIFVVGIFSLVYKKEKKFLIIWIINAIVVFSLYFVTFDFSDSVLPPELQGNADFETLFSPLGIEFFLLFIANGLVPHVKIFYPIGLVVGALIFSLFVVSLSYFYFQKEKFEKILPWMQLAILGMLTAIMTAAWRAGEFDPMSIRWIPMATLTQIPVLVMTYFMLIKIFKNKKRTKNILIYSVVILLSISLIVSYVSGWYVGEVYWSVRQQEAFDCLTKINSDFICPDLFIVYNNEKDLKILSDNARLLKENSLGPFANIDNLNNNSDLLLETKNWENLERVNGLDGSIVQIDEQKLESKNQINVNKSKILIRISGWGIFDEKSMSMDSAYLFIDNEIHRKLRVNLLNEHAMENKKIISSVFSGWDGWIDLRSLEKNCHEISVRLVKSTQYFEIEEDTLMCIK